jgi:hypothetical protein
LFCHWTTDPPLWPQRHYGVRREWTATAASIATPVRADPNNPHHAHVPISGSAAGAKRPWKTGASQKISNPTTTSVAGATRRYRFLSIGLRIHAAVKLT